VVKFQSVYRMQQSRLPDDEVPMAAAQAVALGTVKDRRQLLQEYQEQKRLQREAESAKAKPAF
jgi:hypothetical protein